MSARRLVSGGRIDRARSLSFTFEGRTYFGFVGDTLASALLANGVSVVGRSFKYHRPRGLLAAGVEEPNALMQIGAGARSDANLRATEIELYEGLTARAVNCWPSVHLDLRSMNSLIGRFIPAGFYYKTFMWPQWRLFEPFIRRAAGLGTAPPAPDPDRYETRFAHCDVLVVGAGPAGIAAAVATSRSGARVILCEQLAEAGGRLLWDPAQVGGEPGEVWVRRQIKKLEAQPETRILTRTTALGYFDHNSLTLLEGVVDDLGDITPAALPRQRLWQVRAKQVVLATGAMERPLVFPGNDRPGVMLASAVQEYLGRFGVRAGDTVVLFTNNDWAYGVGRAMQAAGAKIAAIVDARPTSAAAAADAESRDQSVLRGAVVVGTRGRYGLRAVKVRDSSGQERWIRADLLAMSGGFNPTVQLFRQSGGVLTWSETLTCFKPGASVQAEASVGAAAGVFSLGAALQSGHCAGEQAAGEAGFPVEVSAAPQSDSLPFEDGRTVVPLWRVEARGKAFVDFQNDVTVADIELSARENFVSVEHLKRYTTLGMATDQGKTSNVNALAIMSMLTGQTIQETGTTLYRFPFAPLPFGALGGRSRGKLYRPIRRLAAHAAHERASAVFEEHGGVMRPAYYPRAGETAHRAEQREAKAVRERAGLFDASPLGKIEVVGPAAGVFLDRIYANPMSTLKVGRCRYGLMLNEQGVVIDDGITVRITEDRFVVGTTGGGAGRIAAWLDEWLQCEWPDLEVLLSPVTCTWGVMTVSGPMARAVLAAVGTDIDLSATSFPHMSFREGVVAGGPARISRVGFTGEVSFEVSVPARRAENLWTQCLEIGRPLGLEPVGVDAWMVLRTEKGFPHIGADTDGSTIPDDIGWGHVVKRKQDFVGRRSLNRPDAQRPDRLQLVGLQMISEAQSGCALAVGVHIKGAAGSDGYVTSAAFSPVLGRGIALAMVRAGRERAGELVTVLAPDGPRRAKITALTSYDPEGSRLHG